MAEIYSFSRPFAEGNCTPHFSRFYTAYIKHAQSDYSRILVYENKKY